MAWLAGAIGLLSGVLLNRWHVELGFYEVLAATLGAAIAVVGAMLVADHREAAARKVLHGIVFEGVYKLFQAALAMADVAEQSDDEPRPTDDELKRLVRVAHGHWHHMSRFSPYDRMGSYTLASALADVEVVGFDLQLLLEDAPERAPPMPGSPQFFLASRRQRGPRTITSVAETGGRLRDACVIALPLLNH